ncbi:hypothetical protein Q1695_004736 [Nippostrongylus brasiliensis]|nr:hypothetical protein Q1695_004736 [Nippostrongylus brasiliensis]
MPSDTSDSSFSLSDDSISEDDAYVYCRLSQKPIDKDTPKPTLERWRSCRDSGFVENLQPQADCPDLEKSTRNFDDHLYYNILPFQRAKVDHDYTYPAFVTDQLEEKPDKNTVNVRKLRKRIRRSDSYLSTLSTRTVVNGARPYHGPRPDQDTPHLRATFKKTSFQRRSCCVECREEELCKAETVVDRCPASTNKAKNCEEIQLFGRLVLIALEELRAEPNGAERAAMLQRKVEKILRLRTGLDLSTTNEDTEKNAALFEALIERRLRAINDVSPCCYQKIADKLCLTQSAARRHHRATPFGGWGSIRRGVRRVLGLF